MALELSVNNIEELRSEITGRIHDLEAQYKARNAAWEFDRALLNQAYRIADPGFPLVLSARPRAQFNLAWNILTIRDPRFRVVISANQDAEQQDKMNDTEKFFQGMFLEADRRWRRAGNRALMHDLDFYILQGGYALFPLWRKGYDGPEFHMQVWDPTEVYPEYSEDGLVFVARCYETSKQDALYRLGWDDEYVNAIEGATQKKGSQDMVTVENVFWLQRNDKKAEVWNTILVDGIIVKKPTVGKQFGTRIPVIVGPSGGQPFQDSPLNDTYVTPKWAGRLDNFDHNVTGWEGFLSPMRQTFLDLDSLLSNAAEIVRRNARAVYKHQTRDGKPKMTSQQFDNARLITMQVGEDIVPVPPPTSPREREELLAFFDGTIQQLGLSNVAFGSLGIEISGVTLDSLINATQSTMASYVEASQYALAEALLSGVDQFRRGSFGKVDLQIREQRSAAGDRWYLKTYDRSMLPQSVVLKVEKPLGLPDTKLARIQAARAAVGDNRPLLSEESLAENLLSDMVPDFNEDRKKRDEDKVRYSPSGDILAEMSGLMQLAEAQAQRGDPMVEITRQLIQARMAQFQQAQAGMEQRTAGIQAQRQAQGQRVREPSPENLPPEASGVRPEAVDARGPAGNQAITTLLAARNRSVNGA
jgi:hypothetical protein